MSILTELMHHQITWDQAKAKAEQWAQALSSSDPALATAIGDSLSAVKQGASNAIALADTALNNHFADMTQAVEAAVDAALVKVSGGAALPAVPLVNGVIDQIAASAKAVADAWALEAKAKLAQPNPPTQ